MKFIKNIKKRVFSIYKTVKSVSNGKWDFCALTLDYLYCKLRFKINPDEYLKYGFYNFSNRYRKQFLLVKHKKLFRNVNQRFFTASKYIFYKRIPDLFERKIILAPQCGEKAFIDFAKKHKKIIIKPDTGSLGIGIKTFIFTDEDSAKKQFSEFLYDDPCVCEEFIVQHKMMQELNPASVNTIRIVSVLKGENVEIVSATLRTSAKLGCIVDNMANGGVGAQVDIRTGIVSTFGIDYSFNNYTHHPVSGTQIIGFKIPNWDLAIKRVKQAHKRLSQCLLFGWDIAITQDGVDIIEANISPGPRIMQAMDKVPKGQMIIPLIKKDLLKQNKTKKYKFVPDYSRFDYAGEE
ncbi:MAG: hypothetical protein IJA44_00380 [Clostridia bacterium]|nr:hypothetical protein [Clostridia bacterium]